MAKEHEEQLLELLRHFGSEGLFVSWSHVKRTARTPIELGAFLELVDGMLRRGLVRLFYVGDAIGKGFQTFEEMMAAGVVVELASVPKDLAQRYVESGHINEGYDPFDLDLHLGPDAPAGTP